MLVVGNNNKLRFYDLTTGIDYVVKPIHRGKLETDVMYIIDEYLYRYMGNYNPATCNQPGVIYDLNGHQLVYGYDTASDEVKAKYHYSKVSIMTEARTNVEDIINNYVLNYISGNNLVTTNKKKLVDTGELYIPELKETDDALTRIMKLMTIHMKIVLNDYRDSFDKDYSLDNMRSAMNGATVNMTITKFLSWCRLLKLDWKFTLTDNGTDLLNPLLEPLVISNDQDLSIDYGEPETGIFKVPLVEGEDPLKRLIKVCIITKHIALSDYKDKGSTPHLLNNMRSALKRPSRMMFPYFVYWCEVLGVDFKLSITNKEGFTVEAGADYKAEDYMLDSVTTVKDSEDE